MRQEISKKENCMSKSKEMNCKSTKENTRNSNMELLRIVAMLLVIAHHIGVHCCIDIQLTDYVGRGNDFFSVPDFSKKLMMLAAVGPGQAANAIFIIISGYFV